MYMYLKFMKRWAVAFVPGASQVETTLRYRCTPLEQLVFPVALVTIYRKLYGVK